MRKLSVKLLSLALALCLIVPVFAPGFSVFASAETSKVVTDVPRQDYVIVEQDYDDIKEGEYLTSVYKTVDGGEDYPYGNVIDYDYDAVGHNWEASGAHTYLGGWTYALGSSRNDYDLLPYVPTAEDGYTVKFNIRVLQHFVVDGEKVEEYIWFNVYDAKGSENGSNKSNDGFQVSTKNLDPNVWYACEVTVIGGVWTAKKTVINADGATGITSDLVINKNVSASDSRFNQFAFTTYPKSTSKADTENNSKERQQCHFQLDEVELYAKGYYPETYTQTVVEQNYENIPNGGDASAVLGNVIKVVDGGEGYPFGKVVDIDYDDAAIKSNWDNSTADHTYLGGIVYNGKSSSEKLPYVPSAADGYTLTFTFRAVKHYYDENKNIVNETVWFNVYDENPQKERNRGFMVYTSQFEEGKWYQCTVNCTENNGKPQFVGTKALLNSDGTVGTASSLSMNQRTSISDKSNLFCYTFYPKDYESRKDNSEGRRAAHFQIDEIKLTTERIDIITASIDGTAASGTPVLAAYDADGFMTDYVIGKINGAKAEFDIKAKLNTFRDAASVKTMFLSDLASVKPLAAYEEVGNKIWGGASATDTERAALTLTADMIPASLGAGYTVLAYTVPNTYDTSNTPSFEEAGNDLLYLGQMNELPEELLYNAGVYDYTKEDIVILINNGESATVTMLEDVTPPKFTNIVLQLGKNESEINFTWYSISDTDGYIKYAKITELVDGKLPADAAVVRASRTESKKVNYYANKATITGLDPSTVYCYQLINGAHESELYAVTTGGADSFSFVFAGDPQIGRGYGSDASKVLDAIDKDNAAWGLTLSQIAKSPEFSGINFLMSAGDQLNHNLHSMGYEGHELQWDAYSNHSELTSLPTVTVLGNHDKEPKSVYPYHVNEPNLLTKDDGSYYCATYKDGVFLSADYYFTYNNALFLVLNVNNFVATDTSEEKTALDKAAALEHGEFIERVMSETSDEDFDWTIVLYHESPYGTSYHGNYTYKNDGTFSRTEQAAFINMRTYLVPILYENGVDLVLSGHDHVYSRTHVIKPAQDENGNYIDASVITPYEDGSYVYADGTTDPTFVSWTDKLGNTYEDLKVASKPVSVTNPDGIVHITGATSSGSQVNNVEYEQKYTAVTSKAATRQVSRIDISEGALTIVTYNLGNDTTENITEVDRFTIYKTKEVPEEPAPEESKTEITGVQLLLEDDLTMRYNVTLAEGESIADYTVRFTMNGKSTTVSSSEIYNGKYVFAFSKIAPQMIGDKVKAELIKDGEVISVIDDYSILDNVNWLLANNPSEELRTLLLDLLEYGAKAQEYTGYKTDAPVNEGKTPENVYTPTEADDVRWITDSTSDAIYAISAGVRFDSANKIFVKFHADTLEGVTAKFGEAAAEIVSLGNGNYMAYSEGIYATDFDAEIIFTLSLNGEAVQSLGYSVNSYAYAMYGNNSAMADLALAMYRYGVSAEKLN